LSFSQEDCWDSTFKNKEFIASYVLLLDQKDSPLLGQIANMCTLKYKNLNEIAQFLRFFLIKEKNQYPFSKQSIHTITNYLNSHQLLK
jgi:hypothetical protein